MSKLHEEFFVLIYFLQVGKFIQFGASFIGGFVIAFLKGWLLTLVMLSSIPPLVIAGVVMIKLVGKFASQKQAADSLAATIVAQTFGSIRTVSIARRHCE